MLLQYILAGLCFCGGSFQSWPLLFADSSVILVTVVVIVVIIVVFFCVLCIENLWIPNRSITRLRFDFFFFSLSLSIFFNAVLSGAFDGVNLIEFQRFYHSKCSIFFFFFNLIHSMRFRNCWVSVQHLKTKQQHEYSIQFNRNENDADWEVVRFELLTCQVNHWMNCWKWCLSSKYHTFMQ